MPMTRKEMKYKAQDALMHGIGNILGYDEPSGWDDWTEKEREEYREILQHEADRVAKLFGFDRAWGN